MLTAWRWLQRRRGGDARAWALRLPRDVLPGPAIYLGPFQASSSTAARRRARAGGASAAAPTPPP